MNIAQPKAVDLIESVLNGEYELRPIDTAYRKRLEQAGFHTGFTVEYLGLSESEKALIEIKIALRALLQAREALSQDVKRSAPDDTLDALVRELLATGASRAEIAQIIGGAEALT